MKKILLSVGLLVVLFSFSETAHAATLKLNPSSGSFVTGQSFDLNINLDTAGAAIDGVDVYYLHYDPKLLQVVDADPSTAGVQIKPGNLFPQTLANSADANTGKIVFSQVSSGGTTYKGSGVLATVSFRALAAGSAKIYFDFRLGNTADTNVAGLGKDQLTSVTNSQLTITGNTVQPTTTNTTAESTTNQTDTPSAKNAVEVNTNVSPSKMRPVYYVIGVAIILVLLAALAFRRKPNI